MIRARKDPPPCGVGYRIADAGTKSGYPLNSLQEEHRFTIFDSPAHDFTTPALDLRVGVSC